MGSLFKPRTETIVNQQSAANIDAQKASLAKLTDNPAFNYQKGNLEKITGGNYASIPDIQALLNEGSKALRANRYNYSRGAAAFNNNSQIQDAIRNKQSNQINENVALAIPGAIGNVASNATNTIQNAYGNQASGYSDAAKTSLEAYKTYQKPSWFSTILGAAAPFASLIPGVGPLISAGMSAGSQIAGGGSGQSGTAASLAQWQAQQQNVGSHAAASDATATAANTHEAAQGPAALDPGASVAETLTGAKTAAAGTNYDNIFKKFSSSLLNGAPTNTQPSMNMFGTRF